MWKMKLVTGMKQKARGSLTVEAAIVIPVILLCIYLMMDAGITLYAETTELVHGQQMWEEFDPAEKFRKLELLEEVFDVLDSFRGERDGSNV